MLDITIYRFLHLIGIFGFFLAIGAAAFLPKEDQGVRRAAVFHGLALFLILLGGFGMISRLGIGWPWPGWIWTKITIWFCFGGSIVLAKRRLLPSGIFAVTILTFAAVAVSMALWHY